MKRLLIGTVLGAAALGLAPQAAMAVPTVEGDAQFQVVGLPNSNATRIIWSCQAHASEPADAVNVSCSLYRYGVLIDTASNSSPGAATATADVTDSSQGMLQVCWVAEAVVDSVTVSTDTGCVP